MNGLRVRIGERWVGDGEPCYIVAEAGSNHNGNFEHALRLIDVAAEAGADAVKFQTFKAKRMYLPSAGQSDYLRMPRSIYEVIREMEMPDDWLPPLAQYCRQRTIEFLSSAFDEGCADLLEPHVNAFKIASYEMTHAPLLRHIARKKKPMIVSTGTATLEEVKASIEVIRGENNNEIILLQCTASYPTPLHAMNVRALVTLRQATGLMTGLSDHSRNPVVAPLVAVACGACMVEKHFTLSNDLPGPDHPFAVEPHELSELVRSIRQAEQVLGHGRKEVLPIEEELRAFARRGIFSIQEIHPGEVFTPENVAVLRCGKFKRGLEPSLYEAILGRRAVRRIPSESAILQGDYD